ncbi:ecto-ADP-ribosyltransferase 5-like [Anoplopoma fimbria]|uniref:ecto-ADP-ribosyltransferase 5-like n=1 Tax=Anoplopoma fimbria TaxID=229290 RepID=UPI0023EC0F62|nr:ecto-ADP-ribosyltransferase 5-like [Anoplopoma fimbria]
MAMRVIWAAVLLTYGVSTGDAMVNQPGPSTQSLLPLDKAPNSVDDMYDGCNDKMEKVATQYLQNERNGDSLFKKVWDDAENKFDKKWKKGLSLGKEQVIAIYVYTFISGDMYRPFNEAVRTQGPQYTTTFKYHALHFYLTDVIQKLNALRLSKLVKGEDKCLTVYRRVDEYFSQDVVNKAVRFGSFTSSRYGDYPKEKFGDKSCFKIVTCMGADVSKHSRFEIEAEVLIPPYEVFKVTKIKRRSEQPGLQCEVVYTLKSTGPPVSNYNCALFPK